MSQRVAIVTGGAQGIGKAIIRRFLEQGAAAVAADIDAEVGLELEREYAALGRVRFIAADVADEAQVRRLVEETVRELGGIDVLVNNAAIAVAHSGPVTELALSDWNRVLAVNLSGAFLCVKHAAAHLRRRKGAIVNIASTRALMSEPDSEAYAASKGGIVALTHALAVSLGPEVRVNCISPGWIETAQWQREDRRHVPQLSAADHAQHPCGRVGRPEDVAALVEFLASEQSGFITGANFTADGGMTRRMIYV